MDEQAEPIREATRGALESAKQGARETKEHLEQGARDAMHTVAEQATERATAAVSTMAQEGKALATALRGAADQAERDGARLVHGPLRSAATMLERWAEQSESRKPQQWFSDFEAFGRREPLALFGVAAAAGFLGTRVLRAGVQARSSDDAPDRRRETRTDMTMSFAQDEADSLTREATPLDTAPARMGSPMEVGGLSPATVEIYGDDTNTEGGQR